MILLDANTQVDRLPFAITDSPQDMWCRLDEAVTFYAELMDPMADPLREDEDRLLLNITNAVDWLVANTTFNKEAISANEFDWLMFSEVLEGGPRKVWLFIINHMGKELITRNYAQGLVQDDKHLIFNLVHPYLADVGDNLYALAPSPLNFETHWARFTQAVVAQQWLDSMEERGSDPLFSLEQGDLDQDAVERFTGIVREAVLFLSRNYPVLGLSRDDNSYRTATTTPAAAESCWRDNISAAAVKLSEELANRG